MFALGLSIWQLAAYMGSIAGVAPASSTPSTASLLLEDGSFFLTEDGSHLLLEVASFLLLEDGSFLLAEDGFHLSMEA